MNNYLTATQSVCDFFRAVLEPVEVRDEEGRLLGHFTPHVPAELQAKYDKFLASIDLEEIERIAKEEKGKGIPLADVWERIHAMEKQA